MCSRLLRVMARSDRLDNSLWRLAAEQDGLVTRADALAAGLSRDAIAHRVRTGEVVAVLSRRVRGGAPRAVGTRTLEGGGARIWARRPAQPHERSRTLGAARRGSEDRPAHLRPHPVGAPRATRNPPPPRRDADRRGRDTSPRHSRHHARPNADRCSSHPGRARSEGCDQGSRVPPRLGHRPAATRSGRERSLAQAWPSAADARLWVPGIGLTRSELEASFLELCGSGGLPLPRPQARVGDYRPDFLWADIRLVVEVDGYGAHRGRVAFQDDRARDRTKAAGYEVLRFTWAEVVGRPRPVAAELRAALAPRAREAAR